MTARTLRIYSTVVITSILASSACGQFTQSANVIGTGGGTASNTGQSTEVTVGEAVIGISQGVSLSHEFGFRSVAANNAPSIDLDLNDSTSSGNGFQDDFVEGSIGIGIVDTDIAIRDPDSNSIESVSVTLRNAVDTGDEFLFLTTTGEELLVSLGIVLDATDPDALVFQGPSDTSNYESILLELRYRNDSDSPASGNRVIEFVVNDGDNGSSVATSLIAVYAVADDAPVVSELNVTAAFTEDGDPVVVDGDVSVSDPDSALLSGGTIRIKNLLEPGSEVLAVDASGMGVVSDYDSASGILTLSGDAGTGTYEQIVESLTYSTISQDPTETPRTIEVILVDTDNNRGLPTSTHVNVVAANDTPTATDDEGIGLVTNEDTFFRTRNVLLNDLDPDRSDTLNIVSLDTISTVGLATIGGNGTVLYDPNGGFESLAVGGSALDQFSYQIADDSGATSNTATVTVTIMGVNDRPTAIEDSGAGFEVNEDSILTTADVLANDLDPDLGDALFVLGLDSRVTNGVVVGNSDGTFDYDPNDHYEFLAEGAIDSDRFIYTVADGHGGMDTASVVITVRGVNDKPEPVPDDGTDLATDEDHTFTFSEDRLLDNDSDPDRSDVLSIAGFRSSAGGGTVTDLGDGMFLYDPSQMFDFLGAGETDDDLVSYFVTDGHDNGVARSTIKINISGINDLPVAVDDQGVGFETQENTFFTTGNVLANDHDADASDVLTILSFDASQSKGIVTHRGNGTFNYDPNGQFDALAQGTTETDSFRYVIGDPHGETDTATVTIQIIGVNSLPRLDLDGNNSTVAGTGFVARVGAGQVIPIADGDLSIRDADDDTMVSATAVLRNANTDGSQRLTISDTGRTLAGNVAVVIGGDGTGVLTLSGIAAAAEYEQLLAEIRFINDAAVPNTDLRTILVTVNDGQSPSNTAAAAITIMGTNESVSTVTARSRRSAGDNRADDAGNLLMIESFREAVAGDRVRIPVIYDLREGSPVTTLGFSITATPTDSASPLHNLTFVADPAMPIPEITAGSDSSDNIRVDWQGREGLQLASGTYVIGLLQADIPDASALGSTWALDLTDVTSSDGTRAIRGQLVASGLLSVAIDGDDASIVHPGIDLYRAIESEHTFYDFAFSPIPAGFFGPGSLAFDGLVPLRGKPADPDATGTADTIVKRLEAARFGGGPGLTEVVPVDLLQLSLIGTSPILIAFDDGSTQLWDIAVSESPARSSTGDATVKRTAGSEHAGDVQLSLVVHPLFAFTRVSHGAARTFDPHDSAISTNLMVSEVTPWFETPLPDVLVVEALSTNFFSNALQLSGSRMGLDLIPATQSESVYDWAIVTHHGNNVGDVRRGVDDGEIVANGNGIRRISIRFARSLDPATVVDNEALIVSNTSHTEIPSYRAFTAADDRILIVEFSRPLTDQKRYTFELFPTITDDRGNYLAGNRTLRLDTLAGDVNQDGNVDIGDIVLVHSRLGDAVTPETAAYDLDLDGFVNAEDILFQRAHFGNKLPGN